MDIVIPENVAKVVTEAKGAVELITSPHEEDQEKIGTLLQLLEELPEAEGEIDHYFEQGRNLADSLWQEGIDTGASEDGEKVLRLLEKAESIWTPRTSS